METDSYCGYANCYSMAKEGVDRYLVVRNAAVCARLCLAFLAVIVAAACRVADYDAVTCYQMSTYQHVI